MIQRAKDYYNGNKKHVKQNVKAYERQTNKESSSGNTTTTKTIRRNLPRKVKNTTIPTKVILVPSEAFPINVSVGLHQA